jgi:hypothetical protein
LRLLAGLACLIPPWLILGFFRFVPWDRSAYPLPWLAPFIAALPVPEILLALFAVHLISTRRPLFRRASGWLLSLVLGVLAAWSIGEWFYRFFYREHVVLLRDLRLMPGMVNMLFSGSGGADRALSMATYAAALLAALLLGRILYLFILLASRRLPPALPGRAGLLAGLLVLAALQYTLVPGDAPLPLLMASLAGPGVPGTPVIPGAPGIGAQTGIPATQPAPAATQQEPESGSVRLPDVHVFIVESYGHTLFTRERYREAMKPVYQDFADFLGPRGWQGASSFLSSPAFGGRSWLADATLLAGIRLKNQEQYDAYLVSGSRNLSHRLGELGYHRILAASGTQYSTPEWESIHEFDSYLLEKDFGYQGPFITFGRMPDQYLLYRVSRLFTRDPAGQAAGETAGLQAPVFGWYMLSNSHVPFEAQPEYVDDWDSLGDGSIFHDAHVRYFDNNWLWGGEFPEGYLFSIEYELKTIREFMDRYLDPSSLVIILGDHQPRIPISEAESSFSVPVHVLSGNADLLEPLLGQGFQQKIVPDDEALPHLGMEEFPRLLLDVLLSEGR